MPVLGETNFLVPNGTFVVALVVLLLIVVMSAVFYVWPLVGAAMRRQWGWFVAVLLLGPFAGIPWFLLGRPQQRVLQPRT